MGRAPCCEKMGLKKGPWTPEEDQILVNYIRQHGHNNWRALPKQAGLLRCGKSCRLRWTNYLRPDIKRGNFTIEEEETIINLHEMLGNRWSAIAAKLPGRTDNEIKNVWHTHLKKRLPKQTNQDSGSTTSSAAATTDPALTLAATRPTKKRARKAKATRKGVNPKKRALDTDKHEDCMGQNDNNESTTSSTNEDNAMRPTTTSLIKNEPVSPQPCISEVSTVTSTSTSANSENDNSSKENVVGDLKQECCGEIPEINDDFWMEVLAVEDTAMSTEDLPCISQCDPNSSQDLFISDPMYENNFNVHGEDMEVFWYNLLTKSNDLPELTDIL